MFEAYVTNLGLYPERGAGAGEYLNRMSGSDPMKYN